MTPRRAQPTKYLDEARRSIEGSGCTVELVEDGQALKVVVPDGRHRLVVGGPKAVKLIRQLASSWVLHRSSSESERPDMATGAAPAGPVVAFSSASEALLRELEHDRSILGRLHWRTFEELVADLLARQGFDVRLTPRSRDRGVDIYANRRDLWGASLWVVECKRYAPDRPVGPELVRGLYGVVERERASGGILATTSVFTTAAKAEAAGELAYRLSLRDATDIQDWAREIRRKPL